MQSSANDKIALERYQLYLKGLYYPDKHVIVVSASTLVFHWSCMQHTIGSLLLFYLCFRLGIILFYILYLVTYHMEALLMVTFTEFLVLFISSNGVQSKWSRCNSEMQFKDAINGGESWESWIISELLKCLTSCLTAPETQFTALSGLNHI
jgi:hypothetical protein